MLSSTDQGMQPHSKLPVQISISSIVIPYQVCVHETSFVIPVNHFIPFWKFSIYTEPRRLVSIITLHENLPADVFVQTGTFFVRIQRLWRMFIQPAPLHAYRYRIRFIKYHSLLLLQINSTLEWEHLHKDRAVTQTHKQTQYIVYVWQVSCEKSQVYLRLMPNHWC